MSLFAEVRQCQGLLGAWQHLHLGPFLGEQRTTGWFFTNAFLNPLAFLPPLLWRLLPRVLVVCLALGAATALVAVVLESAGASPAVHFSFLEGVGPVLFGLHAAWWSFALCAALGLLSLAVTFGGRGLFPTSFEAFRAPSRRSWLVVCWLRMLAALLGVGALVAGSTVFVTAPPWSADLPGRLGVLVLLPVWAGLAFGLDFVAQVLPCRTVTGQMVWRTTPFAALGFCFPVFFLAVSEVPLGAWWWAVFAGYLALVVLLFAAIFRIVDRAEPRALVRPPDGITNLLIRAGSASPGPAHAGAVAPVAPLAWMRGRSGLFWSLLYADLRGWGDGWKGRLAVYLVAGGLLAIALSPALQASFWGLLLDGTDLPRLERWLDRWSGRSAAPALVAAVLAAILHPLRLGIEELERPQTDRLLYRLGADAGAWDHFHRRTWWCSPLLLFGGVLALALGPTPDRLAVVALVAGALLLRAGWLEHSLVRPRVKRLRPLSVARGVVAFLGACYLLGPGLDFVFALLALFLLAALLPFLFLRSFPQTRWQRWRDLLVTQGLTLLAYGAYLFVSRLPLWPSWTWAAAALAGLVGLLGMVDWLLQREEELEWNFIERPAPHGTMKSER